MKVSQFCVIFTLRSGLLTPLGFELVTVLGTFCTESLFRFLLKFGCSRLVFKEDHRESNVSSRPFRVRKMIDQIFFVVIRPGFEPALFFELVRGSKRDPSPWL